MARNKRARDAETTSPASPLAAETQYVEESDDSDNLWEVLEILGERGPRKTGEYLVQWKGIDPETNEPWEPSWTKKEGCTPGLISDWKAKQAKSKVQTQTQNKKRKLSKDEQHDDSENDDDDDHDNVDKDKDYKGNTASFELPTRKTTRRRASRSASTKNKPEPTNEPNSRSRTGGASVTSSPVSEMSNSTLDRHVRFARSRTTGSVQAQLAESSLSTSKASPTKGRSIRKKNDHTSSPTAGPGPTTVANRSQQSPIAKSSSSALDEDDFPPPPETQLDVDLAEENHNQPINPESDTESINHSFSDPIRQFSASPQPSPKPAEKNDPPNIDPPQESDAPDVFVHAQEEGEVTVDEKAWIRIERDGEEGERLVASDDDSDDELPVVQDMNVSIEQDLQDEDLDILDSEEEDGGVRDETQAISKVDTEVASPTNNDAHIQTSPPPPSIHPDTIALETARSRITHLVSQLQAASQPKIHPDSLALGKAQSKVTQLEIDLAKARTEAQSKIAQLEDNLRKARESTTTKVTPITASPNNDARTVELEADITKLQQNKASLTAENGFLRERYRDASDKAVAEVQQVNILKAENEKLKSQVTLGLKQKQLHLQKVAKERESESIRLRAQNKILLDQARLTDDGVRKRAAAYSTMKKENEELTENFLSRGQEIDILTKRIENLTERNEELVDQLETIRAMRMGIIPDANEGDSDGDSGYENGGNDSDLTDDSLVQKARRSSRSLQGVRENDVFQASAINAKTTHAPTSGYACFVREGERGCKVICETIEQLHEHVVAHHQGVN